MTCVNLIVALYELMINIIVMWVILPLERKDKDDFDGYFSHLNHGTCS